MSDFLMVITAAGDEATAKALLGSSVKAKLAGSGQYFPVSSAYWHEGEYGEGTEYKVLLMTTTAQYDALEAHLTKAHNGENWEITAVELAKGSAPYLAWLTDPAAAPASEE